MFHASVFRAKNASTSRQVSAFLKQSKPCKIVMVTYSTVDCVSCRDGGLGTSLHFCCFVAFHCTFSRSGPAPFAVVKELLNF